MKCTDFRSTSILILLVMLVQTSANLIAQDKNPAKPLNRLYHDLVTHDSTNKVYLFGGTAGHGGPELVYTKVWAYDPESHKWNYICENRAVILGITTKTFAMSPVLDKESNRIVFFNLSRKTWAFHPESKKWQQMAPEIFPLKRCGQHAVYDSESDRIILFGGFDCNLLGTFYNDTWAYDYNTDTWEEMNPADPPMERAYANMVYNSKSDRVMLWGGRVLEGGFPDNSLWEYDYNSNTWSEIAFEGGPEYPFAYSEMVYDSVRNELYLYGGGYMTDMFTGSNRDENWIYHCADSSWTQFTVEGGPGKVSNHSMAFLPGQKEILLIGGETGNRMYNDEMLNGTWILDYTNRSWIEQTFAFAGNDALLCADAAEGRLLGGEKTGWGGIEPYSYSWSAGGISGGEPAEVGALLDDPSAGNPALIGRADSVQFYLEVTDQAGTVAYDTVLYKVSTLSGCPDGWSGEFFRGDSIQLDHCVEGGMEPLSYLWEPAEFLSDSSASRPWAMTDSVSVTFHLVATDTLGCEVTSTYTASYSTVGLEQTTENAASVIVKTAYNGTVTSLHIENRLNKILNVEIIGISGKLLDRFDLPSGTLEHYLPGYKPGLYLYRISSQANVLGSGKFIIH